MSTVKLFNGHTGFPDQILKDLLLAIDPFPEGELSTTDVRKEWGRRLSSYGWVSNYLIPNSRLHISFWKSNFGVCVQLGNTCRMNSDMLKLETLFRLKRVDAAALIVPTDSYSKYLGSNHASVTTAARDLTVFDVAVTLPIAVVGVGPERG
jgi:hypothetical protein